MKSTPPQSTTRGPICFAFGYVIPLAAIAIITSTTAGCDLGTYSQRSTEYLNSNPAKKTPVKTEEKASSWRPTAVLRHT